jgi:hypothetical protein
MRPRRPRLALLAPTLLVAGLPLAVAPPANAAPDILVGCTPLGLVLAFEIANNETTHPGGDTIVLSSGCTYTLTEEYGDTGNALPRTPVGSGITVRGNGAIIERGAGAPAFGVMSISGDVLFDNVTFREFWGFTGAYFHVGGSLQLVNSRITNVPPTGQQDSAIQNESTGTVLLQDTVIENQFDVDGGGGSAVENKGFLAVSGSTFRNDTFAFGGDPGNGGAILNTGTAYINDSTFTGNRATATGGAIRNAGYLEIDDSSFTGNGGVNFGAAIANSSDLIITDSFFSGNDAAIAGGAIYNDGTGLTQVDNSTFHDNTAGLRGGAIENRHSVSLEHVTFAQNDADTGASFNSEAGGVGAEASVFTGTGSQCAGTVFDFGANLVHPSAGACPSGFTVGDPKLTAPDFRGGSTKTMALLAGSAAVDLAGTTGCPATDQRGFTRPQGAGCDAGALENQPPTAPGTPGLTGSSSSPNGGTFGLGWTAATDPDGTPLTYRLLEQRSDQHVFTQVATPASPGHSFANHPEGVWRYRVQATDGNLTSGSSSTSSPVMVDRTAPTAPTGSADRPADYAGDNGWYADTVTVSFGGSTDPVLVDGNAGSGVASYTAPVTFSTSGSHTATGTATDGAGNVSTTGSLAVQVDATGPQVAFTSCPGDVILGSSRAAAWAASDAHSGLATPASGSITLDTGTIGTRTVTTSATDNVGHTATASCTFRVVYDFTGFFKPVVNPPASNPVVAGDQVVLKFSLAGDQGLAIMAPGYPQSAAITCGTSPELESGTATSSRRGLQFLTAQGGRYSYSWATDPAWAGTCRQVIVLLDDGTYHRANVSFS